MITAKGRSGSVEFDGRTVTIIKRLSNKAIPLAAITAVQFKAASALVYGFIEFTVPGSVEMRSRAGHSTQDAAKNENAIVFSKKQMPEFDGLRIAIQEALRAREDRLIGG